MKTEEKKPKTEIRMPQMKFSGKGTYTPPPAEEQEEQPKEPEDNGERSED